MAITTHNPQLTRVYAWFSALLTEDTDLLDDLLAHGVPIDSPHPLRHTTALMEATRLGRTAMVHWLLARGAAPAFLCGLPQGTALHCAIHRQHWPIASLLTARMVSGAVMDAYQRTPLHTLCMETIAQTDLPDALAIGTMLIAKQCPLDALDYEGTTALHHCVVNDSPSMAELLLAHGANPNALIPDSGVSPLTIAALEQNQTMARVLLAYQADPHIKTRDGTCAATIFPSILQWMKEVPPSHDQHNPQPCSRVLN